MNSTPNEPSDPNHQPMDYNTSETIGNTPQQINRPITRSFSKRNQTNSDATPNNNNNSFSSTTPTTSLSSSNSSLSSVEMNSTNKLLIESVKFEPAPSQPQKTYQKIIINEKPCNIINILENSRLTGRTLRNISSVCLQLKKKKRLNNFKIAFYFLF